MKLVIILAITVCFHHIPVTDGKDDLAGPLVVTIPDLGQVRGSFLTSVNGRRLLAFRGIPYAKPPVGNLRFEDPVAADPWHGKILDATKEGSKCVQYSALFHKADGEEDCLYLNVYTHNSKPENGFLKPVMVWIHGGSFMEGSGNGENDFYGPGYIMDRDVVFVTINYRLTALGFFSTGDSEAPGNYGLLDQSLALRWVREHIGNFGGDPSSVTIFGESAGGASVEYHILSPHSKGLFDRAISQSGSTLSPWASLNSDEVVQNAKILAEHFNCPSGSTREMVKCLRGKDAKELVKIYVSKELILGFYPQVKFGPRVDKERKNPFLPDESKTLIQQKRFNSVPIIIGLMQNEASFLVAALLSNGGRGVNGLKQDPERYLPFILGIENMKNGQSIAKAASKQYFGDHPDYEKQLTQFEQMISDYSFNKPIDNSAHLFSQYGNHPVYYYQYTHKGQFSLDPIMGAPPGYDQGISHASELFLMFTNGMMPPISTPGDIKVSKLILDLWTSFATDGIPKSHLIKSDWVPMAPKVHSNYLRIEANDPGMVVNQSIPFHHRLAFWDTVLNTNNNKDEL